MGKASSAKKIERVQRAGTTKTAGQRRNIGFPLAVTAVIMVGVVLVALARDAQKTTALEAPTSNDYWHSAFGAYECDEYLPTLPDSELNPNGIRTRGDGLIHINPFGPAASGHNAVFGLFAEATLITLEDDKVIMPPEMGGQVLEDGTCEITNDDGETEEVDAELALFVWPPQATENVEPQRFTEGFADLRFTKDKETWVLAMVPEGTEKIPLPPTVELLDDVSADDSADESDEGGSEETPAEDAPAEGDVDDAPAEGDGDDAPAEGDGSDAPTEGDGEEAPADDAPADDGATEEPAPAEGDG